jgi:hypothetical protein
MGFLLTKSSVTASSKIGLQQHADFFQGPKSAAAVAENLVTMTKIPLATAIPRALFGPRRTAATVQLLQDVRA